MAFVVDVGSMEFMMILATGRRNRKIKRRYWALPVLLQKEYRRFKKTRDHYYLVSGRVLYPTGRSHREGQRIKDGYIARVFPMDGVELHDDDGGSLDVRGAIIAPGLIDLHQHRWRRRRGWNGRTVRSLRQHCAGPRPKRDDGNCAHDFNQFPSGFYPLFLAAFSRVKIGDHHRAPASWACTWKGRRFLPTRQGPRTGGTSGTLTPESTGNSWINTRRLSGSQPLLNCRASWVGQGIGSGGKSWPPSAIP